MDGDFKLYANISIYHISTLRNDIGVTSGTIGYGGTAGVWKHALSRAVLAYKFTQRLLVLLHD